MKRNAFSESAVVEMSRRVIRNFYNLDRNALLPYLSDGFMWIGANDEHWAENLGIFFDSLSRLPGISPVTISDEEYHLLFHERNIWILYGRHKATSTPENGPVNHAHMRFTLVWRKYENELRLIHMHASNSGDIPLKQFPSEYGESAPENVPLMEHFKKLLSLPSASKKLMFKDLNGVHRFLLPEEVIYLEADLQRTVIHTKEGSFPVHGLISEIEKSMPESFYRIHKSYLLNSSYVDSIFRYKAKLKDGILLPIGRDRYMDFKRYLSSKHS